MIAGVLLDIEGTLVGDKRYQPTGRTSSSRRCGERPSRCG